MKFEQRVNRRTSNGNDCYEIYWPFAKELLMEYAAELNQLIKLETESSIG